MHRIEAKLHVFKSWMKNSMLWMKNMEDHTRMNHDFKVLDWNLDEILIALYLNLFIVEIGVFLSGFSNTG